MRLPHTTYRLQLHAGFDLHQATRVLPYLQQLGVDWVYLSPALQAEPGSEHGYDVIAHDRVDEERGGADGLAEFSARARDLGLGVLVDIVPNHVGVATPKLNRWWWEVLRDGLTGARAAFFDVDWEAGAGRLRIPLVGDDDLDADGRIHHLSLDQSAEDGTVLRYHDHEFPVSGPVSPDDTAEQVHARQHYELVSWRAADDRLTYRRFFGINTLAGLRVEDRRVFEESHVEIGRWFDECLVDGVRVDHPDGLRDPAAYLRDLADLTGEAYCLVEKILEPGEDLESGWATHGTTGYDALGQIDRVLVDADAESALDALETRLRGEPVDWGELVHGTKRAVTDGILGSEVARIVREVRALLADGPPIGDAALTDAVAELLTCFPVYRSYLPDGREHLEQAFGVARRRRPDLAAAYDVLHPILSDPTLPPALRFQQTSGMVMAKGVEDCAFYRSSRLTSLNEVGGDPSQFSLSPTDFHAWAARRQAEWPHAMTATSTHDTKRSEDTRARITVLSELPGEWESALDQLLALAPLPDPGFANLLWQAALGAWPVGRERLHAYAEKAMREAGDRTRWTSPDESYEGAVHAAVDAAFDDEQVTAVLDGLARRVAAAGWSNGLSAKLVALTLPGVPDVYQGSERWEQSLVDPDNRRPVDFERLSAMLSALDQDPPAVPTRPHELDDDGSAKLLVTASALRLRRDRPELFGSYAGLEAEGPQARHVLAFDRGGAITVATRLPIGLERAGGWGETVLDLDGCWVDGLTGALHQGRARLADLVAALPVALLTRAPEPEDH